MTAKTKLLTLEKRLDNDKRTSPFALLAKIERWTFGLVDNPNSDLITIQEWDEYKKAELKKGTARTELERQEAEIRARGGFMEIIFVGMDGKEIN